MMDFSTYNSGYANQLFFAAFETSLGWFGLSATKKGISQISLPRPSEEETLVALNLCSTAVRTSVEFLGSSISRIQNYCRGQYVTFDEALDLSVGSTFEQQVWYKCRTIPYGQTRSYGWLAAQLGRPKAARAVGNALGKNPVPIIIPCHRVIAANNRIGGFSGGIELKKRLLDTEGITPFHN